MSNGKEFQNVWLRKKKDLLRLLMLVVVEAIFDTNERLSVFVTVFWFSKNMNSVFFFKIHLSTLIDRIPIF